MPKFLHNLLWRLWENLPVLQRWRRDLNERLESAERRAELASSRADRNESRADGLRTAYTELSARLSDRDREMEDLAATVAELTTEKRILTDRLEQALSDRARNWDLMREALAGEREALHLQINYASQQRFGVAPYPNDPKLPEAMIPHAHEGPTPLRRMTASQKVQEQSRQFVEDFTARVKQSATT